MMGLESRAMAGVGTRGPAAPAGPLSLPPQGVPALFPARISAAPCGGRGRKVHPRSSLRARAQAQEKASETPESLPARSGVRPQEEYCHDRQLAAPGSASTPAGPAAAVSPVAPRRVLLVAMGAAIPAGVAALGAPGMPTLPLALADAETSADGGSGVAVVAEAPAAAGGAQAVAEAAPPVADAPATAPAPASASAPAQDLCSPLSTPFPGDAPLQVQTDPINAYAYAFPASLPLPPGTAPLNVPTLGPASDLPRPAWVLTRPPERYSSAAPLSPDARLRIVSERLFVAKGAVLSVAISPPNSTFLQLPPPAVPQLDAASAAAGSGQGTFGVWTPVNVSRSVLADRTSPRMTTAQRLQETVVGGTSSKDYCGTRYYYYEFLNARSPTTFSTSKTMEVFRHSVAATAEREGYLYTITASCLDGDWAALGPTLRACVNSFRLLPPTNKYVPPYKDPWRFW